MARRVPDACHALGIGRSTIYKLAAEGKIKLVHIAGRTVVPESEIARLAVDGTPTVHKSVHKKTPDCGNQPRTTADKSRGNRLESLD